MNEFSTIALNFSTTEAKELITRCLWENDPETYPERKQEYLTLYGRVTFAEAEREYRYLSFMAKVYWKLLIASRCDD